MKLASKLLILMLILSFGVLFKTSVSADWWDRDGRPVLPREEITIPTNPPSQPTEGPQPTSPPSGGTEINPTTAPSGGGESTSEEDPCAPGKSYTGPYCGWSPRVGGEEGGGGGGGGGVQTSAPSVRGLSYTSGDEIGLSDIMLLSGLLCLLMYVKSKFTPEKSISRGGKRK